MKGWNKLVRQGKQPGKGISHLGNCWSPCLFRVKNSSTMEVAHIKPSMATKHLPIIPELWEAEAGPSVPVQPELHGALSNQGYKLHLRIETFQLPLSPWLPSVEPYQNKGFSSLWVPPYDWVSCLWITFSWWRPLLWWWKWDHKQTCKPSRQEEVLSRKTPKE